MASELLLPQLLWWLVGHCCSVPAAAMRPCSTAVGNARQPVPGRPLLALQMHAMQMHARCPALLGLWHGLIQVLRGAGRSSTTGTTVAAAVSDGLIPGPC